MLSLFFPLARYRRACQHSNRSCRSCRRGGRTLSLEKCTSRHCQCRQTPLFPPRAAQAACLKAMASFNIAVACIRAIVEVRSSTAQPQAGCSLTEATDTRTPSLPMVHPTTMVCFRCVLGVVCSLRHLLGVTLSPRHFRRLAIRIVVKVFDKLVWPSECDETSSGERSSYKRT